MKNKFAVLITVLVLSMTACGENSNQVQVEKADQAAANDEMVEKIDYSNLMIWIIVVPAIIGLLYWCITMSYIW